MPIYDLFISYSSKDRVWADKLQSDLQNQYPSLRIFFDRNSIPAGFNWRQELDNAIYNSKHLLFLWSKNADSPNTSGTKEVDPEIEAYRAHRKLTPELEGSKRVVFYVPLEGDRGGGVTNDQGFPAFKPFYDPNAGDLGISKLDSGPALGEWSRMLQMVGDAISAADSAAPVIAGIVATNLAELELIDGIHGRKKKPDGPTLDDFLSDCGLTWEAVRGRYGIDALNWRPTGMDTIVTLLEQVRVRVNADLAPADRFQWKYLDLTSEKGYKENIRQVYEKASVVVLDPISLYDSRCPGVLLDLQDYVSREESVFIALSPNLKAPAAVIASDLQAMYFRSVSGILEDYLQPKIPPGAVFYARCALDVQRMLQIDPLIRNRIRYPLLAARRAAEREAAKDITRPR